MATFVLVFSKFGQKEDKDWPLLMKRKNHISQPMLHRPRVKGNVGKGQQDQSNQTKHSSQKTPKCTFWLLNNAFIESANKHLK